MHGEMKVWRHTYPPLPESVKITKPERKQLSTAEYSSSQMGLESHMHEEVRSLSLSVASGGTAPTFDSLVPLRRQIPRYNYLVFDSRPSQPLALCASGSLIPVVYVKAKLCGRN